MRSRNFLLFGFALLFVSFAFFYVETVRYEKKSGLSSDFDLHYEEYNLEVNNDMNLYISKYKHQKIELIKDNNMTDQVKVVVEHPNSSVVTLKTVREVIENKERTRLYITSEMNVTNDDLGNIVNLALRTVKDKVKYNYFLLKYGNVYVYANEKFLDNIVLVNYGFIDEE